MSEEVAEETLVTRTGLALSELDKLEPGDTDFNHIVFRSVDGGSPCEDVGATELSPY